MPPAATTRHDRDDTAGSSAPAPPAAQTATPPPAATTRHDRDDTAGSSAPAPPAAQTASVAMRAACPSSRLIVTATARANDVHAGALHPNPAFALRHHSVR